MVDLINKDLELSDVSSEDSFASEPQRKRNKDTAVGETTDVEEDKQPKDKSGNMIVVPGKKRSAKPKGVKNGDAPAPKKQQRGRPRKAAVKSLDERIHDLLTEWLALKREEGGNDRNRVGFMPVFFR